MIWLPLARVERRGAIQVRVDDLPAPLPAQRVLVVDDNADAAETLAMVIGLQGHEVRVAADGASGLREAEAWRPDIVFLDIGMPGMNGYEVAARLRSMPGWRQLLLVALTGWGTEEDRARSVAAGFDVHLTKPVEPAAVEALLARLGQAPAAAMASVANTLPL